MQLQVLPDQASWHAISPEWENLVCSSPAATPFQLPVWLLTWWAHFGSGVPQVLTFRENSCLVGIMPVFRHEWNGKRQLTLMGTGLSDWTDPILPAAALPQLARHLEEDLLWNVLDWQDLAADSPLRALPGLESRPDTPCMQVQLAGSFEDFWAARSKDLRRNVRRYRERAQSFGTVEFEVTSSGSPGLIDDLVRLHGERWQRQGEAGMIASNYAEAFLRDVAERLADQGRLRIFYLRFKGQVTAINLGVLFRNEYFAYMSAFDPEHEELGFGRLLLYEAFCYCFEGRISAWNFLRGQEAYKESWGASTIPKIRLYKAR